MMLDNKRTKRLVLLGTLVAMIAFAGSILAVIIVLIVGGGPSANLPSAVDTARSALEANPNNAQAHQDMALALASEQRFTEALPEAQKAVRLDRNSLSAHETLTAIAVQANQPQAAVDALLGYTKRRPKDPQGFLLLGQVSETSSPQVAILAYQTYLRLAPSGQFAGDVRTRLMSLTEPVSPVGAPTTPTTRP